MLLNSLIHKVFKPSKEENHVAAILWLLEDKVKAVINQGGEGKSSSITDSNIVEKPDSQGVQTKHRREACGSNIMCLRGEGESSCIADSNIVGKSDSQGVQTILGREACSSNIMALRGEGEGNGIVEFNIAEKLDSQGVQTKHEKER
eukprot:6108913-Ditylum_brightwellii.AAC.1